MLNAARAHGIPMMVIAMTTAAISQPTAIQRPPKTIHKRFSTRETGDMTPYLDCERAPAIGGGRKPEIENPADLTIDAGDRCDGAGRLVEERHGDEHSNDQDLVDCHLVLPCCRSPQSGCGLVSAAQRH